MWSCCCLLSSSCTFQVTCSFTVVMATCSFTVVMVTCSFTAVMVTYSVTFVMVTGIFAVVMVAEWSEELQSRSFFCTGQDNCGNGNNCHGYSSHGYCCHGTSCHGNHATIVTVAMVTVFMLASLFTLTYLLALHRHCFLDNRQITMVTIPSDSQVRSLIIIWVTWCHDNAVTWAVCRHNTHTHFKVYRTLLLSHWLAEWINVLCILFSVIDYWRSLLIP